MAVLTDVANIKDLTIDTTDNRVVARELDINRRPAQVGAHGEVRDRSDHGDGGGDIVEDAVVAGLGKGEAYEGEGRAGHDGRHGPIPIRAMSCDGDVDRLAVDGIACIPLSASSLSIPVAATAEEGA